MHTFHTIDSMTKTILKSLKRLYKIGGSLLLTIFMQRSFSLIDNSLDDLIALDASHIERDILNFKPPSKAVLRILTLPFRQVLDPVFLGWNNIPKERPILFVSNHTIMGFDYPIFMYEVYKRARIFPRVLADHSHFQVPVNGEVLRTLAGAVDGTRRNVELLIDAKQAIFVYPGGAREVFKKTSDTKYDLKWENRNGFAYMAVKHGVTIVPVINFGTEDMLDVIADLPLSWLPIPFLWGSDRTLPIIKPSNRAKIRRIYFLFGQPIRTDLPNIKGGHDDPEIVQQIKIQTKTAIENGINFLRNYALEDNKRRRMRKIAKGLNTELKDNDQPSAVENLANMIKDSQLKKDLILIMINYHSYQMRILIKKKKLVIIKLIYHLLYEVKNHNNN